MTARRDQIDPPDTGSAVQQRHVPQRTRSQRHEDWGRFTAAGPVKVTRADGSVEIQPSLSPSQLDRLSRRKR